MKRIFMTAAALALLTATAQAQATSTSRLFGIAMVYDRVCEKIPNWESMSKEIAPQLALDDMMTGIKQAKDVLGMMGQTKFCVTYKPAVDIANRSVQ